MTGGSPLRREICRLLTGFDDEALVALGNRGLLRRATKDIERAMPAVVEETADAIVLSVDEHRVRIDRGGPAQATCSCPATSTCQHVLAALLALRNAARGADEAATETTPSELSSASAGGGPEATSLHESLLAMEIAALRAHSGTAGYRWALEFARDVDLEQHLRVEMKRPLRITLLQPHLVAHYGGGGVEAILVEGAGKSVEKRRVAAVLVYQRAHGRELVDLAPARRRRQAGLDLGDGRMRPATAADENQDSRTRLAIAVQQLAGECLAIGLCHLSPHVQQRCSTLAVWAQGAELPRLARLLRRIADHVELLLDRAGAADEERLLDDLAIATGLAGALAQAASDGRSVPGLVGSARRRFHEVSTLGLIGLGARTFRSPTGFHGLTMVFWSPSEQAFTVCTDARPSAMRGFDPVSRYRQPGPWIGLAAPEAATGRSVTLTGARRDELGRIAASDTTHAFVQPLAEGALAEIPSFASWSELGRRLDEAMPRSLLSEPLPNRQWALLRPAGYGPASFDRSRQVLRWPLVDATGTVVNAVLPWSTDTSAAIGRIEGLGPEQLDGALLVGHLRRAASSLIVEPLSLLRTDAGQVVDGLHFAPLDGDRQAHRRNPTTPNPSLDQHGMRSGAVAVDLPQPLTEVRSVVRQLAERGVPPATVQATLPLVTAALRRATAAGFDAFPRSTPTNPAALPLLLLRVHYVMLQYERLIAPVLDDDAPTDG